MKANILLWKLGILPANTCPVCKHKTVGHGYDEWGECIDYYTCEIDTCEFNQEDKRK